MDRHHDNDHHGRSQPDLFKRCRQDQSCCGHCRPDEPCLVELGGDGGTPVRVQSLRPVPMSAACGFSADGSYMHVSESGTPDNGGSTVKAPCSLVGDLSRCLTGASQNVRLDKHVVCVFVVCSALLTAGSYSHGTCYENAIHLSNGSDVRGSLGRFPGGREPASPTQVELRKPTLRAPKPTFFGLPQESYKGLYKGRVQPWLGIWF